MPKLARQIGRRERPSAALVYEIRRASAALMFLLEGMETVRARQAPDRAAPLNPGPGSNARPLFALLSEIANPLTLEGAGLMPEELLGTGAEAEQLAYRGWLERVAALGGPEAGGGRDVLSELRLIHEDLTRNRARASRERSGRCALLRWFRPGERIVLGLRHVLDLLNQLGSPAEPATGPQGASAGWGLSPQLAPLLAEQPAPEIVSLRSSVRAAHGADVSGHAIRLAFANGVFGELRFGLDADTGTIEQRLKWLERTRIDASGDLRFADGFAIARGQLYRAAVRSLDGRTSAADLLQLPDWALPEPDGGRP